VDKSPNDARKKSLQPTWTMVLAITSPNTNLKTYSIWPTTFLVERETLPTAGPEVEVPVIRLTVARGI